MTQENKADKSSIVFTYHDPGRTFDGSPFEAAGQSVQQSAAVLKLAQRAIYDTEIQVRNAYLQRNLENGGDPKAGEWENSPEAKLLGQLASVLDKLQVRLRALHQAATFDPSEPIPKEDDE